MSGLSVPHECPHCRGELHIRLEAVIGTPYLEPTVKAATKSRPTGTCTGGAVSAGAPADFSAVQTPPPPPPAVRPSREAGMYRGGRLEAVLGTPPLAPRPSAPPPSRPSAPGNSKGGLRPRPPCSPPPAALRRNVDRTLLPVGLVLPPPAPPPPDDDVEPEPVALLPPGVLPQQAVDEAETKSEEVCIVDAQDTEEEGNNMSEVSPRSSQSQDNDE